MAKPINVPANNHHKVLPQLTPDIVGQLLENQSKELQLKANELSLQKQLDDHNYEFSKQALGTQAQDRKEQREHDKYLKKGKYILTFLLAFLVSAIIIVALYLGKDTVAIEIIKAICFVIAGGLGGYGIGKGHTPKNVDNEG